MTHQHPTSDHELNAVLHDFVTSIQSILGRNFIAAYLQGSFAVGDWDVHSDVDFLVVVEQELTAAELAALQAMHGRLYDLDSHWAQHLEGSYFPRQILQRCDPANDLLYYLDNGSRELERSNHCNTQVVRWVAVEHGITLAGPDAKTLIDPVSTAVLQREVAATMRQWGDEILTGQYPITSRWAQPYVALSCCRMLHTLATGRVESKQAGAAWGRRALGSRWADLIERAWVERPNPWAKVHQKADPAEVEETLAFVKYAVAKSTRYRTNKA